LSASAFAIFGGYGQLRLELSDLVFIALFHGLQLLLVAFGEAINVVFVRLPHSRGFDG
jgi:hypothetical protein